MPPPQLRTNHRGDTHPARPERKEFTGFHDGFAYFSKLPTELRAMIWQQAITNTPFYVTIGIGSLEKGKGCLFTRRTNTTALQLAHREANTAAKRRRATRRDIDTAPYSFTGWQKLLKGNLVADLVPDPANTVLHFGTWRSMHVFFTLAREADGTHTEAIFREVRHLVVDRGLQQQEAEVNPADCRELARFENLEQLHFSGNACMLRCNGERLIVPLSRHLASLHASRKLKAKRALNVDIDLMRTNDGNFSRYPDVICLTPTDKGRLIMSRKCP